MTTQWFVYLIRTRRGYLYTGIATDIERRFREHRDDAGGRGAKFFLMDEPLEVVYCERCPDRVVALRRERDGWLSGAEAGFWLQS